MLKLICAHADTCLSDYWSGHHAPHICVPVHNGMSFKQLREELHGELRAGAIAGAENVAEDDAWLTAAHAAINRDVKPAKRGARNAFPTLEKMSDEDMECGDSVYAYFVFLVSDESRFYFLRSGADELEKAQRFDTMRAAVAAFERDARSLARFGQRDHTASVHIAQSRNVDDIAEYPDFVLSLGARDGVKVERA